MIYEEKSNISNKRIDYIMYLRDCRLKAVSLQLKELLKNEETIWN